jgi:hypothetical protein
MRASISKYELPFLVGFLTLTLAEPIRPFQDGASRSQTPSSKPLGNDGGYKWIMAGQGFLEGVSASLEGYKGPNGERISTVTADFGVVDAAKAAHQHFDLSAAEIVKQEDVLDDSGKVIGQRSILT